MAKFLEAFLVVLSVFLIPGGFYAASKIPKIGRRDKRK